MTLTVSKFKGALLGLAIGDAIGAQVEFQTRGSFPPVTDMVGGGVFRLPAGAWTDDTSMALCLAESLLEKGFDPKDQMERYVQWWQHGYMSSTGRCFDIGGTTREALVSFLKRGHPYSGDISVNRSGNGSIMRLAPIALYYARKPDMAIRYAGLSSCTTHASHPCVDSCDFLVQVLIAALNGADKDFITARNSFPVRNLTTTVQSIISAQYRAKTQQQISSGGYVLDTLEAAMWCFYHGETYEETVLLAANLGDDADTVGAVAGQIAGAYYGMINIPQPWIRRLIRSKQIALIASRLYEQGVR